MGYKVNVSDKKWREIGSCYHDCRDSLFTLMNLASPCLPVSIVQSITRAIDHIDAFSSRAESRMFSQHGPEDLHIFGGPSRKKT